jgi:hypothetical protein
VTQNSQALVARTLGLCLVLPQVYSIYHSRLEQGAPGRTDYLPPFNNRGGWGRFDLMFDLDTFVEAMHALGVPVLSWEAAQGTPQLPAPTFEVDWGKVLTYAGGNVTEQLAAANEAVDAGIPPRHTLSSFDGCFGWGVTRGENRKCAAFGGWLCHQVTESLQSSRIIAGYAGWAVAQVRAQNPRCQVWVSAHMREFNCDVGEEQMLRMLNETAQHLVGQLGQAAHAGAACIYIISELSPGLTKRAFAPVFHRVARKEDVLPSIRHDIPFDVMAQIDFEIGNALADLYFAQRGSSSDDYIVTRRRYAGRNTSSFDWDC